MATDLTKLNEQQNNAILESIDSNVALFAGAGSGKTKTIVTRAEYLIDDLGVNPENIMMITFTNKAAKEILERVAKITPDAYKMWIGTFHSICVRLLRKFGHYMGINYFSIIDDKESKSILKQICLGLGRDLSNQSLKDIRKKISAYKSNLIKPEKVLTDYCQNNLEETFVASAYREYQNQCWREKSFDFDDLIIYTIMLLSSYPEVSNWVHENIKYLTVDECLAGYQYVRTSEGVKTIKTLYDMYTNNKKLPLILSYNINTFKYEYKPMTYAHKTDNRKIYEIKTEGLNKLHCTDNHKVLTQRGYVEVKDLVIGKDMLILTDTDKQKTKLVLNEEQYQICLGSYLGDGHLDKRSKYNTYRLRFTQGLKQKEYFLSKIDAFNLDYDLIKSGYTNKLSILSSKTTNTFVLKDDPFELVLKEISPLGLAIWYQDDGSFQCNTNVRLYSEAFTYEQNIKLQFMLNTRFNILCDIKKDKKYYYLSMDRDNSKKFLSIVSPYMHPSMQYKTSIDISNNVIKYNNNYKNYGANYISSIEYLKTDSVYDITVADNHNFITSKSQYGTGIIVHNCQDTSTDQYQLVRLLAGQNKLMMVGDINQSIYGFRNARPEYLNDFCRLYPNAKLLKLEKNYRSTGNIILAANAVINNNSFGEKINMQSANELGDKIGIKYFDGFIPGTNNEVGEAKWIASEIKLLVSSNQKSYEDFAIIYRTNIQSKDLEKVFFQCGIPYTVIGSSSFWGSKEMKDILAFCKVVFNPNDITSFKRALSTIRGVGKTTIDKITGYMKNNNLKACDVLSHIALNNPTLYKVSSNSQSELNKFNKLLNYGYTLCSEVAKYVIDNTAYADDLRMSSSDEAQEKLELINETIEAFLQFEKNGDDAGSVIDQISLMSDAKGTKKEELNAVKLMSAHSCKGLEFDTVFVSGVEEGLFPHWNSLKSNNPTKGVEEERRLFYVAMTRAKKKLYLTACKKRKDQIVKLSRFIDEIPKGLLEECF